MYARLRCAFLVLVAATVSTRFANAQPLSVRLDQYLRERSTEPFSGVVLVAQAGRVVYEAAFGLADAELSVPNRVGTRFPIGSLTKPFTATAVMRLAERRQLKLADSICQYLTLCPDAWRGVTLRHLLSHTSGIPDLFKELPAAPVDSTRAVTDRTIAKHLRDTLRSPPGLRYAYSNFNYFLLAYALETVSGKTWGAVLREEIFGPASMRETEYDDVWAILPRRARGYDRSSGSLRNVPYKDHAAYAAGGLLSSAYDLLRFDQAVAAGRIVADSTLRIMTTPGLGDYGLGWQVIRVFGHSMRNHTGVIDGFASHLANYDDGTTVIVLSNIESEPAKATACDIAAITFGFAPTSSNDSRVACRSEP